jgi:3-deoxy-D-manno-octulosonate 8-phosphate phosphatase (KDO 8-P phosphatase)
MEPAITLELQEKLKNVRILVCDVDGVLTDGSVWVGDGTCEYKAFDIQDGLGLVNLRASGVRIAWISNRPSIATSTRAEQLKIDVLKQSKASKRAATEEILYQLGYKWTSVCYVGDDIVDLGAMTHAGVAIAPCNAVEDVRAVAHYVTRAAGGHGAIREACELIIKAQGHWNSLLEQYRSDA